MQTSFLQQYTIRALVFTVVVILEEVVMMVIVGVVSVELIVLSKEY